MVSVARKFFGPIEMSVETKDKCVEMVQYFHSSTEKWAESFFLNLKRKYYVTPTSYLELIITFKTLLDEKRTVVMDLLNKYSNGYDKIITTESKVENMQVELNSLIPKLEKAKEET